jgi:hypothetical protein
LLTLDKNTKVTVSDTNIRNLAAEPALDFSNTAIKRSSNLIDIGASYLTEALPRLFPTKFPEGASIAVIPLTQGSVSMTFLVTGGVEPLICRASPNHDFGGNQNQHESEWAQYHKEQYWVLLPKGRKTATGSATTLNKYIGLS